ncbi:MAG: ABC transporter permease, partial [Candidatus Limnocylindrales bacterium]
MDVPNTVAPAKAPAIPVTERLRGWLVSYGVISITVGLLLFFSITEETFRRPTTILSMLKYASVIAIAGLGVTTAMVVGGIDLSVGGVAGMAVTIAAMSMVIYNQ